jgi:hypothetical protein
MEKGKEKIRRDFYGGVVRWADAKHARITSEQASEMSGRILRSFASQSDGGELADGFVAVTRHFAELGFWRGYKKAKKHYAALNSVPRPPYGRRDVHLTIEKMLEEDLEMSAEEICKRLDKEGLSDSFYPTKGKQKVINVGPFRGKVEHKWVDVYKDDFVKGMISRIRTRLRNERRAGAWTKLAGRVFSSGDRASSKPHL